MKTCDGRQPSATFTPAAKTGTSDPALGVSRPTGGAAGGSPTGAPAAGRRGGTETDTLTERSWGELCARRWPRAARDIVRLVASGSPWISGESQPKQAPQNWEMLPFPHARSEIEAS